MRFRFLVLFFLLIVDQGVVFPSLTERGSSAQKEAIQLGFEKEYLSAGLFTLATFHRLQHSSGSIRIYIEGDGRAWENKFTLSADPTPSHPIALELALRDNSDSVAYIARPGQFPKSASKCDSSYWSKRRFAPEVIEAIDQLIDIFKHRCGAKNVEIIGYSGGAAIAILIAGRRSDVLSLRTVAGNLDPNRFCIYHRVSPLDESLNPLDVAQKIALIPQRHFIGSDDWIMPSFIAKAFIEQENKSVAECLTIIDGATHQDGWLSQWEKLLLMPLAP